MAVLDTIFKEDFRVFSSEGDVTVIKRRENVESALAHRLSTFKGSVPFRPNYGAEIKRFINEPFTHELQHQIVKEVREQVLRETRVKSIQKIEIDNNNQGRILVEVEVLLVGEQDLAHFSVII